MKKLLYLALLVCLLVPATKAAAYGPDPRLSLTCRSKSTRASFRPQ